MAKLTWHNTGDNQWETGVDNVILFFDDKIDGTNYKYAWNGVTSISNSPEGAEPTDIYADNIKYLTLMSAENFKGSIEAYTYPVEFAKCCGEDYPVPGFFVSAQTHINFGLCYRTKVGDEVTPDKGYKYHFIYNCKAGVSEKQYQTINDSPEAITFSWNYSTTPVTFSSTGDLKDLKPTAYMCVDTTKLSAAALTRFNTVILGGINESSTKMMTIDEIYSVIKG